MNVGAIADQLAQMFGANSYSDSTQPQKDRILVDFNAAIEAIQDAGEDFFGREDLSVPLVQGQVNYILEDDVQTVLKPAFLSSGQVLTQITSRGAFYRFANHFLDQISLGVENGTPTHYFVESKRGDVTDEAENVKIQISVLPAPTSVVAGTTTMVLQVIREPGLVTAAELAAGTASLRVPHKYVESIFLPIARYNAMGSTLFYDRDKAPHLEDDYIRALQLLGKADPRRPVPADSTNDAMDIRRLRGRPQQ